MKKFVEKMLTRHGGSCVPDFGISGESLDFEGNFLTCWQLLTDFVSPIPKNERFKNLMNKLIEAKKSPLRKKKRRSNERTDMNASQTSIAASEASQCFQLGEEYEDNEKSPECERLKLIRQDFERLVNQFDKGNLAMDKIRRKSGSKHPLSPVKQPRMPNIVLRSS